jgi:hypothetical protein
MGFDINNTILSSESIGPKGEGMKPKTSGLVFHFDGSNLACVSASYGRFRDLSGNENSGDIAGGASYSSTNSGGIYFQGTGAYTLSPNSTSLNSMTNNMSLAAWFSVPQNGLPFRQSIFCKNYTQYELDIYPGGYIHTYTGNGPGGASYDEGTDAFHPSGDWIANKIYNVVWTLDGRTEKTYFEGTIAANGGTYTKGNAGTRASSEGLNLGRRFNGDLLFKGNIYIAQVYNRTLSAVEALQHYNAYKGRFGL